MFNLNGSEHCGTKTSSCSDTVIYGLWVSFPSLTQRITGLRVPGLWPFM